MKLAYPRLLDQVCWYRIMFFPFTFLLFCSAEELKKVKWKKHRNTTHTRTRASNKDNVMQVLQFPSPFCLLKLCLVVWLGWEFGESWGRGHFQGRFCWESNMEYCLLLGEGVGVLFDFFFFHILLLIFTYSCKIPSAWLPAAPPKNKQLASWHIHWDM